MSFRVRNRMSLWCIRYMVENDQDAPDYGGSQLLIYTTVFCLFLRLYCREPGSISPSSGFTFGYGTTPWRIPWADFVHPNWFRWDTCSRRHHAAG